MSNPLKPSISPLQARMIEDMTARKLSPKTQTAHIRSCRRFAAWLGRSPETALPADVRRFQLALADCGISNSTRNIIMTGVTFLFRVTLRRHDLVAEIYHLREPQKIPPVMSQDEVARLLASTMVDVYGEDDMGTVALRQMDWDAFVATKQGKQWMQPIASHLFDEHGVSLSGVNERQLDSHLDRAAKKISETVPQIFSYRQSKRSKKSS